MKTTPVTLWILTVGLTLAVAPPALTESFRLPLGDGHITASPRTGSVFACPSRHGRDGIVMSDDPWVRDGAWFPAEKPALQGNVPWPSGRVSIALNGNRRVIEGNGLPNHGTGVFPVSNDDPASRFDRNPNRISPYTVSMVLPAQPEVARQATCVSMGAIGVMISGAGLFNALDEGQRDAPAHEVQDTCNGHPQMQGIYHYHGISPCITDKGGPATHQPSDLLGYALDGFGIYGPYGDDGKELFSNDLDECHGRVSDVLWDGKKQSLYHYHLTRDYPYTIGCYRGTPVVANTGGPPSGGMGGGGPPSGGPPSGGMGGGGPPGGGGMGGPPGAGMGGPDGGPGFGPPPVMRR